MTQARGVATLEDGAYRVARIGLRVLRGDGDPSALPQDIYAQLRQSVDALDTEAAVRAEAAVMAVPEEELLDILESYLSEDGQEVDKASAAAAIAVRPDVIHAVLGVSPENATNEAKLGAAALGLGTSYLAVEDYLDRLLKYAA